MTVPDNEDFIITTPLIKIIWILDAKPVKSGRKKKELEVQADRVANGTEQSTSLLKSPMSPKKGLGKQLVKNWY